MQMQQVSKQKLDNLTQITKYHCDFDIVCNGTSQFGNTHNRPVHVTAITLVEHDNGTNTATVEHDSTWDVYTDTAFEAAVAERIGTDLQFANRTLQDDYTTVMYFYR